MPGKHNAGGCGCCTDVCTQCTNITYITISGLTNPNCTGGCDGKNGTYVFRAVGDAIPSNCNWCVHWGGNNCGLDDTPSLYIGGAFCGSAASNGYCVTLTNVTGGIKVTVEVVLTYEVTDFSVFPSVTSAATYSANFEKTFASCAAISGTLPRVSTSASQCTGSAGDPGDLCGLYSATVGIG